MLVARSALDFCSVATPKPLDEVAQQFGVKPRTMWNLVRTLELTKYKMPGRGKRTYLDPDEVRRKMSKPLTEPARDG